MKDDDEREKKEMGEGTKSTEKSLDKKEYKVNQKWEEGATKRSETRPKAPQGTKQTAKTACLHLQRHAMSFVLAQN